MDVLNAMQADAGIAIKELRVDGGATANNLLMQFQSDLLQTTVIRPTTIETTALGAAYLAGLATGYWSSTTEIQELWQKDKIFKPLMSVQTKEQLATGWGKAIHATVQF